MKTPRKTLTLAFQHFRTAQHLASAMGHASLAYTPAQKRAAGTIKTQFKEQISAAIQLFKRAAEQDPGNETATLYVNIAKELRDIQKLRYRAS